jgi:hypothetical protein
VLKAIVSGKPKACGQKAVLKKELKTILKNFWLLYGD